MFVKPAHLGSSIGISKVDSEKELINALEVAAHYDDKVIRHAATQHGVPCITTLSGAAAATLAIRTIQTEKLTVRSLQEYHSDNKTNIQLT